MLKTSLKTVGIDHVVLYTRDLARARRFYTEVLGMEVAHENERQCFLRCGDQQVAMFQAREYGAEFQPGGEMNHMALRLAEGEYEEVKARLEAEGCTVSGRGADPYCIYFNDPDGHRLQVLTPKEQQHS